MPSFRAALLAFACLAAASVASAADAPRNQAAMHVQLQVVDACTIQHEAAEVNVQCNDLRPAPHVAATAAPLPVSSYAEQADADTGAVRRDVIF